MEKADIIIMQDGVTVGTARDLSYDFVRAKTPIYADGAVTPTSYQYGASGTVGRITFEFLDTSFFDKNKAFTITLTTGSTVITLSDNFIVSWTTNNVVEFRSDNRPTTKLWKPAPVTLWQRFVSWLGF